MTEIPAIRQGRPPQDQEPKQLAQVMLEPTIIRQVETLAREQEKTKSAMLRLLILAGLKHQ